MKKNLTRGEGLLLAIVVVVLVGVSVWQNQRLRAIQHEISKAHYAERVRTAQLIVEGEMLRAAYFTAINDRTKHLAKTYLETFPK